MNKFLTNIPPLILAFIAVVIWGFNFVIATVTVQGISPFLMLSLRFLLVFIVLMPFYPKTTMKIKLYLQRNYE